MLDQEPASFEPTRWPEALTLRRVRLRGSQEEGQEQEGEHQGGEAPEGVCDQACAASGQRASALRPDYLPRVSRLWLRSGWQAIARRDGFQSLRRWRLLPKARFPAPPTQSQQRQETSCAWHARTPDCSDTHGLMSAQYLARRLLPGGVRAFVRPPLWRGC